MMVHPVRSTPGCGLAAGWLRIVVVVSPLLAPLAARAQGTAVPPLAPPHPRPPAVSFPPGPPAERPAAFALADVGTQAVPGDDWVGDTVRSTAAPKGLPELEAMQRADTLFRDARRALLEEQYDRAATLFRQLRLRHPATPQGQMAAYWEAFALQRQGGVANLQAAQSLLKAMPSPQHAAVEAMGQGRPSTAQASGGTLRGQSTVTLTAGVSTGDAQALQGRITTAQARAGDREAEGVLLATANSAASDPGCPSASEDERIAALQGVAQLAPDTALRILTRVLKRREPCTQQLRRTAVFLLGASGRADWGRALLPVVNGDPDLEVRKQAVLFLANALPEESAPALLELALTADDEGMRRAATRGLAHARRPQDAAARLAQLYDQSSSSGVRRDVLMLLGDLPAKAGVEKLMAVVRTEKNSMLRRMAVEQLVRTKDPRALALLEEILNR
jgi:HEAT repeat protein